MTEYVLSEEFKSNVQQEMESNPFAVLSRLIYQELYQEVIEGHLLPEHKIIESKIAKELNVSRSPVKVALSDMVDEGIFFRGVGKTVHVKPISYEECLWIYEARMTLEPKAAYQAAKRIKPAELQQLMELISKFEEIDNTMDQREYTRTDKQFHEIIIKASRNPYLVSMYKSIECPLACYRNQLNQLAYEECFQQHDMGSGSEHHKAIFNMLKNHLPLLAEDEMRNDIQRMYGTMSRLRK
ncbi:GntR family transcriptional regulator [Eubacterium sp. am_0171]|uniref:GntR family transcriptional regulator n=1 Tax=Clostridia TaxID=186801 RepID=UPI001021D428|nr:MULTISPECIES: GntR family transcriptional regulator [Clostridia]MSC85596.1 FCD domain-containing protein [Eubacterium sp. BIOML-A1]MSD08051.1 FCD domain-containing protein [Eubacterium sp. BIOML-A2]RYT13198.1 GntR family transcriptional regulator [Eubacterium sp. am_0171]